jgi:hypothetical protein
LGDSPSPVFTAVLEKSQPYMFATEPIGGAFNLTPVKATKIINIVGRTIAALL